MITICHSYSDGTYVEGTAKGDAAGAVLAATDQWRWWRSYDAWGLRDSHHRLPKWERIDRLAETLRAAGCHVELDLDEHMPPMPVREQDEFARAEDLATVRTAKARCQQASADADRAKADAVFKSIPYGQPVLIGHHSAPADLARRQRAANQLDRAIDGDAQAAQTRQRAATAAARGQHYASPHAVAARIEALEPEERRLQREVAARDGEPRRRYERRLQDLREQLAHWRARRAEQIAAGEAIDHDAIELGDWIRTPAGWLPVRKVNKKTYTVPDDFGPRRDAGGRERTRTCPKHKVKAHRRAEEIPADLRAHFAPDNARRWA